MKLDTYVVLTVSVLLLVVYALTSPFKSVLEPFDGSPKDHDLLPAEKIFVTQGIASVPAPTLTSMNVDAEDPVMPSVDGTPDGPKSLFMFAYNKCDIKCCDESPYSCQGGCVCMTKAQRDNLASRGRNVHKDGCAL